MALRAAVDEAWPKLVAIGEAEACEAWRGEVTWSRKQVMGHLVDSASNNHQRFVRAAIDGEYVGPGYAQEQWVAVGRYQEAGWAELISFWRLYNLHLAHVLLGCRRSVGRRG